jgi:hypothetical protein
LLRFSPDIVEPLIALSIVLVAVKAWFQKGKNITETKRIGAVIFLVGLFHGFGFSFLLTDLGVTRGQIGKWLLLFNIGIELGQLVFLVTVFLMLRLALERTRLKTLVYPAFSIFLAAVGIYFGMGSLGFY